MYVCMYVNAAPVFFRNIKVIIHGLGLFGWLIDPIIDLIISLFKGPIADAISDALYDAVNDVISQVDLLAVLENL